MSARRWRLQWLLVLCVANIARVLPAQGPAAHRTDAFGDPIPAGALMRLGTTRLRTRATAVAFAADGKTIFTATGVNGLARWDTATGRLRDEIALPGARGMSSWFSADAKLLAVGEAESFSIWDTASGNRVQLLERRPGAVAPVAFGGGLVAIGEPTGNGLGHVRLWDLATGKSRVLSTEFYALALTFDRAGKRLFGALHQTLRCWDVATGKLLWQNTHWASHIALSSDDAILVADSHPGREPITLWNSSNGKQIGALVKDRPVTSQIVLAPDGRTLAQGTWDRGVLLWDMDERKLRRRLPALDPYLAFSPDGRSIVTAGKMLQRWDVATGKPLFADTRDLGHVGAVRAAVFAPDGRALASSGADHTVRLWDLSDGRFRVLRSDAPDQSVRAALFGGESDFGVAVPLEFTPDGRFLLSDIAGRAFGLTDPRGGALGLTDLRTGQEARRFQLPHPEGGTISTITARLTADGKRVCALGQTIILYASSDSRPRPEPMGAWNTRDGHEVLATSVPIRLADAAAFAPDGRVLLVASTHRLHDLHTGTQWPLDAEPGSVGAPLAFSPDGRLVAMANPGLFSGPTKAIQVFEVLTGRRAARITVDLGDTTALGFSGDGRLLAAAGHDALHVWQIPTGKRVQHLEAKGRLTQWHDAGFATTLDFSPGGTALATGHADGTIHLWDLDPARQALAVPAPKIDAAVCWTDLAAADAAVAYAAIDRLAAAPDAALPALKRRLHAVRIDPAWLTARIRDLDDDDFDTRQDAMRELSRISEAAESALRRALAKPASLESRRRIDHLLDTLRHATPSSDVLRQMRALTALERIGNVPAQALLRELATGAPEARLTRESHAALARLARRAAAVR